VVGEHIKVATYCQKNLMFLLYFMLEEKAIFVRFSNCAVSEREPKRRTAELKTLENPRELRFFGALYGCK
jgi:hypothetical protein